MLFLLNLHTLFKKAMKNNLQVIILLTLFGLLPLSVQAAPEGAPFGGMDTAGLGLKVSLGDVRQLKMMGFIQSHFDYQREGNVESNDFNIKRAILMADAKLSERLSFWLMVDAAAPTAARFMHEYYAQYAFCPAVKLRIGQFKLPFTLENMKPMFFLGEVNMNESVRYFAGVQGDALYGNFIGRDMGAMLTGDLWQAADGHYWFTYYAGLFNGAGMNQRDNNTDKDFVGMLNLNVSRNLIFTTSCMLGRGTVRTASPFNTLAVGNSYDRQRLSVGVEWHSSVADLRSEWIEGRDGSVRSRGGYAELCIHTLPKLDVVLDYDYLNRNTSLSLADQQLLPAATQNSNYTIGLQYWVHRLCRVATQYVFCDRRTGTDAHQWVTQFQIVF